MRLVSLQRLGSRPSCPHSGQLKPSPFRPQVRPNFTVRPGPHQSVVPILSLSPTCFGYSLASLLFTSPPEPASAAELSILNTLPDPLRRCRLPSTVPPSGLPHLSLALPCLAFPPASASLTPPPPPPSILSPLPLHGTISRARDTPTVPEQIPNPCPSRACASQRTASNTEQRKPTNDPNNKRADGSCRVRLSP